MFELHNTVTGMQVIHRITDGAWIPLDPANTDYQAYLEWLEAGNEPEVVE